MWLLLRRLLLMVMVMHMAAAAGDGDVAELSVMYSSGRLELGKLVVNEVVVFEVTVNKFNASAMPYQVELDFGDGSAPVRLGVNNASSVLHTYDKAGSYSVIVTDVRGALAASSVPIIINAESDDCLSFAPLNGSKSALAPLQTATIEIGLTFHRSKGSTKESVVSLTQVEEGLVDGPLHHSRRIEAQLTSEFIEMGEAPRVQLVGDPHVAAIELLNLVETPGNESDQELSSWYMAEPNARGDGWSISVKAKDWPGTAWLRIKSSTYFSLNGDCTIMQTDIPIVVTPLAQTQEVLGASSRSSWPRALQVPFSAATGRDNKLADIRSLPCLERVSLGLLSGGLEMLITFDGFETYHTISLRDHVTWGKGTPYGNTGDDDALLVAGDRVCGDQGGILDCDLLAVEDLAPFSTSSALLVTNQGLFILHLETLRLFRSGISTTSPWRVEDWTVSYSQYCPGEHGPETSQKVQVGYDVGTFVLHKNAAAYYLCDRVLPRDDDDTTTSAAAGSATGANSNDTGANELYMVRSIDQFVALFDVPGTELVAVDASMNDGRFSLLYSDPGGKGAFIGRVCNDPQSSDPTCFSDQHGIRRLYPSLGFVFPRESQILGLCPHATGLVTFAFGDALWASSDAGRSFTKQLTLGANETLVDCPLSSASSPTFFVRTSLNRIFFGQLHIPGMAQVVEPRALETIPHLAGPFELGLARLDSGWGAVEKINVPLNEMVRAYRLDLGAPLMMAASFGSRIPITCPPGKGPCFGPQHEGMVLMPMGLVIQDVDLSTDKAFVTTDIGQDRWLSFVRDIFGADKTAEQCELQVDANVSDSRFYFSGSVYCNKVSPLSLRLTIACPGASVAALPRDTLVLLAPEYGSGSIITTTADGDGSCALGALSAGLVGPAAVDQGSEVAVYPVRWTVPAGAWETVPASTDWWLEFAPCQMPAFKVLPLLPSPSLYLMDKFDMFLWRAVLDDDLSTRNRAYERKHPETWSSMGMETPTTVLRSNSQTLKINTHEYTTRDAIAPDMSYNRVNTTFDIYQRIAPNGAILVGIDRSSPTGRRKAFRIEPSGESQGVSTILVGAKGAALSCPPDLVETGVVRLLVGCPHYKRLEFVPSAGANFITLPVNYRPPSHRGKGIPLTPNVYNADANQPLFMDWYQVSRESAEFKQCANTSLDGCGCQEVITSDSVRQEGLSPAVSDCIRTAQTTPYSFFFVPTLRVHLSNADAELANGLTSTSAPLKSVFRLRDVNGRTDYCTNSTRFDKSYCGETNDIWSFDFNPKEFDAILFMGEGLYHFEVTIQDPISFCVLKTHMMLFVLDPPLSNRIESITIAVTWISFSCIGLIGYLAYFYWNRIGIFSEDPVKDKEV